MLGRGCYFITPSSPCSTCWTVCANGNPLRPQNHRYSPQQPDRPEMPPNPPNPPAGLQSRAGPGVGTFAAIFESGFAVGRFRSTAFYSDEQNSEAGQHVTRTQSITPRHRTLRP